MGRNVILRSFVVIVLMCLAFSIIGPAAAQEGGTLTITPDRGPIGTRVTLVARGCADPAPGQNTVISFQGGDLAGSTPGADEAAVFKADSPDPFRATYTIPSRLETLGGEGGGRVVPGRYGFRTYPPACAATFLVTGLATTGPARAPLAALAVLGGLLVAVGIVVRASAPSGRAEPPLAP